MIHVVPCLVLGPETTTCRNSYLWLVVALCDKSHPNTQHSQRCHAVSPPAPTYLASSASFFPLPHGVCFVPLLPINLLRTVIGDHSHHKSEPRYTPCGPPYRVEEIGMEMRWARDGQITGRIGPCKPKNTPPLPMISPVRKP